MYNRYARAYGPILAEIESGRSTSSIRSLYDILCYLASIWTISPTYIVCKSPSAYHCCFMSGSRNCSGSIGVADIFLQQMTKLPSSGYDSEIFHCGFVGTVKERKRKMITFVNELFCIAAFPDKDVRSIFAPENTNASPASCHGVDFVTGFYCDQHPFFSDFCKWVELDQIDRIRLKCVHDNLPLSIYIIKYIFNIL